jgi:D-tyrosyl-tRNA(Tyr) deacylase
LLDKNGDLLLVSQFTLLADTSRGRRPSFIAAGDPARSKELFERLVEKSRSRVKNVQSGWFGEKMHLELTNDGPVTIIF